MDIEKVQQLVASMIDEKLTANEKKEAKAAMEETLAEANTKLEELTTAVTEKTDELTSLQGELEVAQASAEEKASKISELEGSLEELTTQASDKDKAIEEKGEELASITEKASTLEGELNGLKETLEGIEKANRLDARVKELAEAKVLRTGDKLDAQKASVADLDDEAFASYKEDLVSLKEEFASSDDTDKNKETAALSALNIEIKPSDDVMSEYAQLGQALAEKAKEQLSR